MVEGYLTTKEAAQRSGLSRKHIQLLLRRGTIPGGRRFGKIWMVPIGALEDYLKTNRKPGPKSL